MSENDVMDILEPKYNLCIAEDAFEKFQAVSMYEEKEYLTLPANVPPDDHNVASSSYSEINSTVSSTMVTGNKITPRNKLQSQSSTGSRDEITKSNNPDMVVSNSENLNNQETTEESLTSNVLPRKRGRKPKKRPVIPIIDKPADTQSIQNPDISSTPFSSDSEIPTERNVRRTRGRPKKTVVMEQTSVASITEKETITEINNPDNQIGNIAAKRSRGGRHAQKTGGQSVEINPEIKEQTQLNDNSLPDDLDCAQVNVSSRDSDEGKNLQVLEPSDSKSCNNSLEYEDPDDVCLSELKNASAQSSNEKSLESQCNTSSENVEAQEHTVKKRRGRPKGRRAQASAVTLSQHIEVLDSDSFKTNEIIDDDADDLCLSKLKVLTSDELKLESNDAVNKDSVNVDETYLECKDYNDTKTTEDNGLFQQATNKEININKGSDDIDNLIQISDIEQSNIENNEILSKRNTKMPVMADFEYNIDSVIGGYNIENNTQNNDGIITEQSSSRPVRQKTKKFKYDEGSDEDPFANVELSDDEPMRSRRGNKYYSDDEYLPGKRGKSAVDSTDTEVSDANLDSELDNRKQRKKKFRKKSDNQSPRKKSKKEDNSVLTVSDERSLVDPNDENNDKSLDSSDTKAAGSVYQNPQPQKWGSSNTEFENFLAKKIQGTSLEIKKVGKKASKVTNKIDIPVIDPEANKTIEMSTQTSSVHTLSTGVQTTSPYHVPLKENLPLTPDQSERACYFLNSIVKTTAEVGTLMIQKSEDFIKRKINTNHVTDTATMDYCVKKSFLLFQLAKHNLRQMEEDLEKQYDEFLKANDLSKCKQEQKEILPTPKENNSDSDCEIVEVLPVKQKVETTKKAKPEFNPKTVFLNKELSIKITKKPNESKMLNIKGRHTVWINDTVMLKKVKPTQSFLAQDSRNKKPPDNYVTEKMVRNFFNNYNHQRALTLCAPFVSLEWLNVNQECACSYFNVKPLKYNDDNHTENHDFGVRVSPSNVATLSSNSASGIMSLGKNKKTSCPESLFLLCFHTINSQMSNFSKYHEDTQHITSELPNKKIVPESLFRLCVGVLNKTVKKTNDRRKMSPEISFEESIHYSIPKVPESCDQVHHHHHTPIPSLKSLCYLKTANSEMHNFNKSQEITENITCELPNEKIVPKTLFRQCVDVLNKTVTKTDVRMTVSPEISFEESVPTVPDFCDQVHHHHDMPVPTLKSLCYLKISLVFNNVSASDDTEPLSPFKSLCCSSKNNVEKFDSEQSYLIETRKLTTPKSLCLSLKSLCYKRLVTLLASPCDNVMANNYLCSSTTIGPENVNGSHYTKLKTDTIVGTECKVDSLLSLCLKYIQSTYITPKENNNSILTPKTLQTIAFENVKKILYPDDLLDAHQYGDESVIPGLMINCVNTLSEEAFLNLEHCNADSPGGSGYNDFDNEENSELEINRDDDDVPETSWVSKLQMQVLRSCSRADSDVDEQPLRITQIKVEPEDVPDNFIDSIPIKKEPIAGPDEMTIIPGLKSEIVEHIELQRKDSNSYSADEFENFLMSSKLMRPLIEQNSEEIYSQSADRKRMQHEPDDCDVNNSDMLNLLIPQTYEAMNIQNAKGSLMESSSDESNKNAQNKNSTKKVKRTKVRIKKPDQKSKTDVVIPPVPVVAKVKDKNATTEVAVLTRRMKEKIRQEERRDESTDSENEIIGVRLRSRDKKDGIDQTKGKTKVTPPSKTVTTKQSKKAIEISNKDIDFSIQSSTPNRKRENANNEFTNSSNVEGSETKDKNIEIQCNNVDSTEQFEDGVTNFTGFTSIETNEMSNYEKCLKFVYERVIPQNDGKQVEDKQKRIYNAKHQNKFTETDNEPIISPDEPIELLQCEPSMPVFDEINENLVTKKKKQLVGPASKKKARASVVEDQAVLPYTERHGWHCYPVDSGDVKLYEKACLFLEKLPESFVQTYFKYQNIATNKNKSDEEIERLTNLNSLNKTSTLKDKKSQSKYKRQVKDIKTENVTDDEMHEDGAADSDHYEELMPSDEESPRVDNEEPQVVKKQTENNLAKNLLMDDNDSEDDVSIKDIKTEKENDQNNKNNKKHKKKITVKIEDNENLMLTADKMMNKELTLLHAPVVLDDIHNETSTKGSLSKQVKKNATKTTPTSNKKKTEEDSSSEEEKQWVSTKEKLLKKMGKKDSASTDDAKRAKLVSEFIERREGNPDGVVRRHTGKRTRRSAKKFLEREKQLRVLQRELFGEMSNDPTVSKSRPAAWKGRRNIRKVLDKKSLARSTVVANMEEFERKKRLNARQTELRELLGCEEGVNVLVINDEVCLEYDFEEHRPVVTIHPFFTKVMKAHQYEGVKFMWDACFESLAEIESGRLGGGCILAHCMGLGKTLQVLALLHTVLTHPRVGMRRVLVCCPLSTVLNWVDEIHKWLGPVTNQIKVFELSKLKKTYERAYQLEDWYNGGGIFIIGYELFRSLTTLDPLLDDVRPTIVNKIRTALLEPGPDIVVCDEGHLLKNDCSVLAVAMSRVVTKRRIVLTGTPMQNNLREYYCMVNFVKPNLLGTYSEYSNRFENPIMNGQHRDSSEEDIKLMKARTHILHKVLEGCLQRQEASVLYPYLPKKYEYTVFINLTQCQWNLYKHYLNHYSRQLKQNSILKDFHILQKIWSHPQVLHNFQTNAQENRNKIKLEKLEDDLAREDLKEDLKDGVATELWWLQYLDGGKMLETLESSNKFVVVFRILEECVALGDKVLIFSTSLICLNALEYFLKKINNWSLGQEYYRLDGSVPAEVRQKWCREFNADNNVHTRLFLVSTRAGCLGLNMTAANRVIIMDTSWNPAHDIQSIFRVYRFGQKKDCFIYRLVAMGTMEQKIYERSVTKQAVACRVVDEQQIDRHYNMAELNELYRYDEAGSSVVCGVAVGVRDVALLRVARDSALHAVHEHDSLLRSSEQGLPEHERAAAWMQFQQEQADKQMEGTAKPKIPKIALKRVQGQNYTKSVNIKRENIDGNSDDFVTPAVTKPRRGRKPKIIEAPAMPGPSQVVHSEQITPDLPGPSLEVNPYGEETMVQKISEILIKHNFHNRKGSTDVLQLLANVKKIVKQGYMYPNEEMDDVTANIAQVLLMQKQMMHPVNDIIPESTVSPVILEPPVPAPDLSAIIPDNLATSSQPSQVNIDQEVIVPDKRRKRKAISQGSSLSALQASTSTEPESILGFSHDDETIAPDSRKKRRAAVAAEKHFGLISKDVVINLDDEADTDFVPNTVERADKPKAKRRSNNNETTTQDTSNVESISNISSRLTFIESDSDTSEGTVSKPKPKPKYKPGPKTYKERVQQTRKETRKESDCVEDPPMLNDDSDHGSLGVTDVAASPVVSTSKVPNEEEKIPLPLSLLTNKTFINIVAQTYLNGNPMLDEDAAILAAKYSALKALKEAEQSGEDIVSGAIYDIAVKVIGKNLFKQMTNLQTDNRERNSILVDDADVTIHMNDNNTQHEDSDVTIQLKDKKPIETKRTPKEFSRTRGRMTREKKSFDSKTVNSKTNEDDVIDVAVDNQYSSGHVVPVGMIRSAGNIPAAEYASNESILPHDDDDMLIITSDIPPAREQTVTPAQPVQLLSVTKNDGNPNSINLIQTPPSYLDHNESPPPATKSSTSATKSSTPATKSSTPTTKSSTTTKKSSTPTTKSSTLTTKSSTPTTKSSTPTTKSSQQPPKVITISKGKIVMQVSAGATQRSKQLPTPSVSSETICLDSDDEDTPSTSSQSNTPVTTRRSSNTASDMVLSTPTNVQVVGSTQQVSQSPMVIRQVSAGNAPKFVLVPAKDVLPKLLPIEPTKTPSPITKQNVTTKTKLSSTTTSRQSLSATTSQHSTTTTAKQPTTTPTVLSTTTPSAFCLSKLKQARCKPGDIIKISDKGDIEVLQKKNKTKSSSKPTVSLNEILKAISSESAGKTSNAVKAISSSSTSKNQDQSNTEKFKSRSLSISSSSSDSRPASPTDNNPLSILKDVVHIQAAYEKTTKNKNSKSHKYNSSDVSVKTKSDLIVVDKNNKNSSIKQKSQLTIMDKDNKMLKDMLNKTSNKPMATAVKDGLKSIVIDGGSTLNKKPFKTIDLVSIGSVKSGSGASMLGTKIEIKKRGSTAELSPHKKMKTTQMTLQDFNIDDIDDLDDIIELE